MQSYLILFFKSFQLEAQVTTTFQILSTVGTSIFQVVVKKVKVVDADVKEKSIAKTKNEKERILVNIE